MNAPQSDQSSSRGGLHAALHSYIHVARRPSVKPYFKRLTKSASPEARHQGGPWSVPDLCKAYNWPSGLAGGGVIAIVELGGGWVQSDMDKFFGGLGQPVPHITDISVDGTKNTPTGGANSPDGEVALDIEVAGAAYYVATGKRRNDSRLLGSGYRNRGPRRDGRWLRCVLNLVGRGRGQLGRASRRRHGTGSDRRDGGRHDRIRRVRRQRFE